MAQFNFDIGVLIQYPNAINPRFLACRVVLAQPLCLWSNAFCPALAVFMALHCYSFGSVELGLALFCFRAVGVSYAMGLAGSWAG